MSEFEFSIATLDRYYLRSVTFNYGRVPSRRIFKVKDILEIVEQESGVSMSLLVGETRSHTAAIARYVAYFAAASRGLGASYVARFVRRTHSAVRHGVLTVEKNPNKYEPLLSNVLKRLEAA